jgi:hypothetical protein
VTVLPMIGVIGGFNPVPVLLVVGLLVVAGVAIANHLHHKGKREDLLRLAERDTLRPTEQPCGLGPQELAGRFAATPRGDRRFGVRYALAGPLRVTLPDGPLDLDSTCFQWWWEERRSSTDSKGHTTTRYDEQKAVVILARLPVHVPTTITIGPESMFGRLGLTRGGLQVESSEFNRRFRVEGADATLTVQLLDAGLQERLLTEFQGRSLEVRGDLLALSGTPSHRDPSFRGVVGHLPAVRQDLARVLHAVPPAFWRRVGVRGAEGGGTHHGT